jgi:ABC-type transport system involved in multi-copper enzyme maturation permease subunit
MLKAQFTLLFRQRFFLVLCCVALGFAGLTLLMNFLIGTFGGGRSSGIELFAGQVSDISTMSILCIVFAGYFFNKDIANRTINIALCAGVNRLTYWAAKTIAYIIGGLIICLIAPIVVAVGGTLMSEWGGTFDGLYILRVTLLYFATMLAIMCVFMVFSAMLTESSSVITLSIAFCVTFQIILALLMIIFREKEWVEYMSYSPSLSAIVIADKDLELSDILTIAGVDVGIAILLMTLSFAVFRKRDLK